VRLFVAFELPAAVRRAVGERIGEQRERLPAARWVRPENLHLTLLFLGEVPADGRPALEAALAPPCAASPRLTLRLAGAGTYPPSRPARVAWLGVEVEEGVDVLRALQATLAAAVVRVLDVELDRRPYTPHLTLARPQQPWRRDACEAFGASFGGPFGEPFRADAAHLVASESGRAAAGAPRYTKLAGFPLEAAA